MLRRAALLRDLHAQQEQQAPAPDPRASAAPAGGDSAAAQALRADLQTVEQQIVDKTTELKRLQVRSHPAVWLFTSPPPPLPAAPSPPYLIALDTCLSFFYNVSLPRFVSKG